MVHLLGMTWRDVLFAHWPFDPEAVARRLPAGLAPATHGGRAWVGIVAFEMDGIGPRGLPIERRFGEVNLRTYVTGPDGDRGVRFLSLDAADRAAVAVARATYGLPYRAAEIDLDRTDGAVAVRSRRIHGDAPTAALDATWCPTGPGSTPEAGTRAGFLTRHGLFYAGEDRLRRGEIDHPPWTLRPADLSLRRESLFAAAGLDRPTTDPVVHVSPGTEVTAGTPSPVRDANPI